MSKNKVIIIGIDGADYYLTKKWLDRLPNLKEIERQGKLSKLKSTLPPISPSAWTSIFTGKRPDRHGIFGFLKQKEGEYFYRPISSKDRKAEPIWKILSRYGKRSIVVNVPFTYPPDKIKGVMITGLGTPGKNSNFVYPPSYKKYILENYPDFNIDFCEKVLERGKTIYEKEKNITKTENAQTSVFIDLLKRERWDVGVFVLRSLDVIQHFAFDDTSFVKKHYIRVDKLVGKIIDKCIANETELIICSDHGFRKVNKKFYVNNWLKKEGYLKIDSSSNPLLKLGIDAEKLRDFAWKHGLREYLAKVETSKFAKIILKIVPSSSHQYLFDCDWKKSQAFFYRSTGGLIKLNLQSREPAGCIDQANRGEVEKEIKSRIGKVKDPETGRKVIRKVYLKRELEMDSEYIPEIFLLPNEGFELVDYNEKEVLFSDRRDRPGDHAMDGIIISNSKDLPDELNSWDLISVMNQ